MPAVKFSSRLDLEQVSEVRDSEKSHFWTDTSYRSPVLRDFQVSGKLFVSFTGGAGGVLFEKKPITV
jgi:hypothetical protein